MGLPVTVYRWDDAGAPQLTSGKPSSIINILKKCLVDGYGSKPALGWTMAFADDATRSAVFRNSPTDGLGGFVQFSSYNGSDSNNNRMYVQSALFMPTATMADAHGVGALSAFIVGTHLDKWMIVGTSRGFYLTFMSTQYKVLCDSSREYPTVFAGDIQSIIPNDRGAFTAGQFMGYSDSTSSGFTTSFGYMSPKQVSCRLFETDGSNNRTNMACYSPFYSGTTSACGDPQGVPYTYSKILLAVTSYEQTSTITDSQGVDVRNSTLSPAVRGFVPAILQSSVSSDAASEWPVFKTINGMQHILLHGSFTIAPNKYLNLEEWYD